MYTKSLCRSTVEPGKMPNQLQGLGMLLNLFEMSSGPAPGEVVVQVIEFHRECGPVPGLDYVPDIIEIWDTIVVIQEHQGVYNML